VITPESHTEKTVQSRLLSEAEKLFCEHGFEGTSVRDIAAAAGCNIASVNYYFGGKDKLYIEVWRHNLNTIRQARLASIEGAMSQNDGNLCLEDFLRAFAGVFAEPLRQGNKGPRFAKLMLREMIDRRLPENILLNEMIIPVMRALEQALCKVCPELQPTDAYLAILSLTSQLMYLIGTRIMFEQAGCPELIRLEMTDIIEHIVRYSAAGTLACIQAKNS
jgi:AcrR family transcriptional regulator